MIQTKEKFEIIADESLASAKFSLKEENLAHVFNILRSNLYSNKILAVMREYSTNAYDANIENGLGKNPIEITLPTVIDPVFKVRDRGRGLSEDDIFNIYSSYGASTKRETNELVGTLGMGSKSGFSYANSFTVTSFQKGVKKVYEAYIDESDLGTITKVLTDTTDEYDGVEISLTVNHNDIQKFAATAKKFFALWSPIPVFYGNNVALEIDKIFKDNLEVIFDNKEATLYSLGRALYGSNPLGDSNLIVNMGNIAYNVDSSYFDEVGANFLQSAVLIIKSKMGDFTFTTSREKLEMTPATIANLKRYITSFKSELVKNAKKDIDATSTPWEAVCYYHSLNSIVKSAMDKWFMWRGHKIGNEIPQGLTICTYDSRAKKWFSNSYKVGNVYNKDVSKTAFIVNDGGFPAYQFSSRRMLAFDNLKAKGYYTTIIFLKSETVVASQDIKTNKMFEGVHILYLSSFSSSDVTRSKSVFTSQEKVFVWNNNVYFPYSSCWTSVDISEYKTKAKGVQNVYVEINQYMPKMLGEQVKPELLRKITKDLSTEGYSVKVFGVKKGQKIPKDWVSLETYVESVANKMMDAEYAKQYKYSTICRVRSGGIWNSLCANDYSKFKSDIVCPEFQSLIEAGENKIGNDRLNTVNNFINAMDYVVARMASIPKMEKIKKDSADVANEYGAIYDKILTDYPLINKLSSAYGYMYGTESEMVKNVINYINAMWLLRKNHTKHLIV